MPAQQRKVSFNAQFRFELGRAHHVREHQHGQARLLSCPDDGHVAAYYPRGLMAHKEFPASCPRVELHSAWTRAKLHSAGPMDSADSDSHPDLSPQQRAEWEATGGRRPAPSSRRGAPPSQQEQLGTPRTDGDETNVESDEKGKP
jgi:hypothetical protein